MVAGSKPRASPSSISRSSTFYLGRSRILQSSYTSRRLADRIRITVDGIRIRSYLFRTIAYAAEQLHQQVSGRLHPHNGWLNTDQEKDGRRWPPGSEPGAIRIVHDHLLRRLVYLHTISSAAVQLCPDGDPKVIRLLSEGFLAGVKGVLYAIGCHPKG